MSLRIRDIKIEDYKEIGKIRKMPGVIENILSNKYEEEELIKEKIINRGKNQYWYVAEENGKVIGLGILMNHGNLRKKHVGVITLMVNSDNQNKGVGSLLMDKLINLSESLNIIRLELCVFRDNYKAINLYKKFGFKEEGIKVKSALKNGEYADEIMMARISLYI
ncbi:N-acetyltransferase family protein [Clostridium perfringens]|uniref:GNAT family N-acetyltransferase n=2 Tax=Clostridium perfringens TaxID=1502 RepID=A0AAP7BVU0_CLOPF|nr:GNAT family N-acetyltransferase [Clostridium perfringens]EDT24790.1 acetyltransferase, GNAT family [Clostridium perfringens B str. ATCC 3626]EHK2279913.1 GNAT family N-acetyltransferase [Clostridium perfringens]ELC8404554.1 GNAT family N-acetyltransferase [Clostridium perfringens]MBI6009368.1 GNAT family N-acetyltransferase [Clostridium perfringens]MBI6016184.1 GNAT family N-acetyltransferase [Clostridium perfringens]